MSNDDNMIDRMGENRQRGSNSYRLGKYTQEAKDEMPNDKFSVVKDVSRIPKLIDGYKCVNLSLTGVEIDKDATFSSYKRLVGELESMWYAGEVRSTLIKFYIGDAINGGDDVFGERNYQAISEKTHWSSGYLSNICWVCRKVPKENRSLTLNSWTFHGDLARLPIADQEYYKKLAENEKDSGNRGWYKKVKGIIVDEKRRQILANVPEESRAGWEELVETMNPSWRELENMVTGKTLRPKTPTRLSEWIDDMADDLHAGGVSELLLGRIRESYYTLQERLEEGTVVK